MINNVNGSPLRNVVSTRNDVVTMSSTNGAAENKPMPSVTGALSGAIAHMAQQGAPIDMEKVMSVRNAIADGQYPVDPSIIAKKIIDFDQVISELS